MAEMPPLPQPAYRDDAALSRSELLPFRSKKISLLHSRALMPLLVTALTCVVLFSLQGSINTKDDILTYLNVLAAFMVYIIFAGLYFYTGERKHMVWYLIPVAITFLQLLFLLNPYFYVFRHVLPGDIEAKGFGSAFVGMFFGAGLMEELLKAVPALLALIVALRLRASNRTGGWLARGLALEGPVDGLLIGAAAGAAFILLETMMQYVPNQMRDVAQANNNNLLLGVIYGMLLLFPRVLNGVIGHMAWAGISGYFIGLAVSHRKAAWKLLIIGWLTPAILHAFWNSSQWLLGNAGLYVSAALSFFVFLSCLLKAKQLEVSRLGGPVDGHSVLAATPPPEFATAGPAGVVPPPAPGVAGAFTGVATMLEKAVGFTAKTTVPNPGAAAVPPPVPAPVAVPQAGLSIGTGADRYAMTPGSTIDFASLFGPAVATPGCTGSLVATPDGGIELRNTGTATWAVTGQDGATRSVPPGDSVRATASTSLSFGTGTVDIQAY